MLRGNSTNQISKWITSDLSTNAWNNRFSFESIHSYHWLGRIASKLNILKLPAYLKEQLHSLNGGNGCFGDGSSNATSQEVLEEGDDVGVTAHFCVISNQGRNRATILHLGTGLVCRLSRNGRWTSFSTDLKSAEFARQNAILQSGLYWSILWNGRRVIEWRIPETFSQLHGQTS